MTGETPGAASASRDAPTNRPAPEKRRTPSRAGSRDARAKEGNVGSALRSVYQQTVNEDVPDDLMQLLGKLT